MKLEAKEILKNTYRIIYGGCDCYLLDGEQAVMIDCGCTEDNIREFAEALIHKPINSVICTHSHIDHTGHCGLFENVYMTEKTYASSRNWMDENPKLLHLSYDIIPVYDKQLLKLANRRLEIILCDCHAPGNIMILDHTERILFAGDEIDQGQVLLLPGFSEEAGQLHSEPAATVSDYMNLLKKLWDRRNEFDWICTGHNGSPLDKICIKTLIELCEEILSGKEGIEDCSSSTYSVNDTHFPLADAHYRKYSYGGFSLIYCTDSLTERKNNSSVKPATRLHGMCEENQRNDLMKKFM